MTIDPNLMSVQMHLNELDLEAEDMHRAAEGQEAPSKDQVIAPRIAEDWKAEVADFFLSPRPAQ